MAPLAAMVIGSVVRHVIAAVGTAAVGAGAAGEVVQAQPLPMENEWAIALGALIAAISQLWSLWQKRQANKALNG